MADPFAAYNKTLEAFLQGGKTDFATLYSETDKLRQTSFSPIDRTPLMSFYQDVSDRYLKKVEAAKIEQETLRGSVESKYTKAEAEYLAKAKKQWFETNQRSGKGSNFLYQAEQAQKRKAVEEAKTVAEFKALVPGFALKPEGFGKSARNKEQPLRYLSETGERKTPAEIYEKTLSTTFGKYAAALTDIDVFSSQATGAQTSLEAERLKLSKENERRQREFIETKQKLLESAEAIGRAKRPSYIERPL
jgi:hypothetical protein